MVLALLEARRVSQEKDRPRTSVAVVPRSLVFNWIEEAGRFAPELTVLDYTGDARASAKVEDFDVLLTTYGTLRRDAARLAEHEFDYVILDEAQAIKNADHRLGQGGAAAARPSSPGAERNADREPPRRAVEPVRVPQPGLPRARGGVRKARCRRPDAPSGWTSTLVARALRPFILRRTKEQVAPELPEKVEQTIHCDLEAAAAPLLRRAARATTGRRCWRASRRRGWPSRRCRCSRRCCACARRRATRAGRPDPRRGTVGEARRAAAAACARSPTKGTRRWCSRSSRRCSALLRERLDDERITYEYLDGRTRDRAERVARFQTDPRLPACS